MPMVGKSTRRSCEGFFTFTIWDVAFEFAAAGDEAIRAFRRFHTQHIALLHHHRLSDVQLAHRMGDAHAGFDVALGFLGRGDAAYQPLRGKQLVQYVIRADNAEALFLQIVHHGGKQGVITGKE